MKRPSTPVRAAIVFALAMLAAVPGAAASLTVHVQDANGAAVGDAVVYAIPAIPSTKSPAAAEVSQSSLMFSPAVTVVETGAAVSFPNRDTVKHHVYSFSPAKTFQMKLYAGTPATPVLFDRAGVVVLGCNIHDAMSAYILVVDTPYFGKSGANGVVRIDALPAGDYRWMVWHPRMTAEPAAHPVKVTTDLDLSATIEMKP